MKIFFRIIILIAVLLGIVALAKNHIAWAANSGETSIQSVSQDKGDYCDKPWNQRKQECKDKDKNKDNNKCKKHPEKCGSVKPPAREIVINKTGEYSVGGFCTLSVTLNDAAVKLNAHIETPLPGELPDKVQRVRQGCHLNFSSSDQQMNELPTSSGSATICFAAMPSKQMTLYFYNIDAPKPEWTALETTTDSGKACAKGNGSGVYIATFQKP